jgi:hypothetical protein
LWIGLTTRWFDDVQDRPGPGRRPEGERRRHRPVTW